MNVDWTTDDFGPRADAREAERQCMNAVIRRLEAHPVAVGRIAPRPKPDAKPVMRLRPAHWIAVGLVLLAAGAWWLS